MKDIKTEIKKGIKLHTINIDKFKTNLIAMFFTTDLNKENATKNALISLLLRRGTKNIPSQDELSKKLEGMYGGYFDCGLDKIGNNQVFKFYIETINDEFLPQSSEEMWKEAIKLILEIALNPLEENGTFKQEYFEQEKNTLTQIIEGRKDNKAQYALNRCIEEMYKDEPFGLYKYGAIEDIQKIENKELYEHYKQLIQNCKIDIYVSGNIPENEKILNLINEDENVKRLQEREAKYSPVKIEKRNTSGNEKIIEESMEVTQGKLVLGLDIDIEKEQEKYNAVVYNAILGGSANSKMFQNVREKAHLAYVASSSYLRHKNTIFINSGIEIGNYEKALKIIREQVKDMEEGNFTDTDLKEAKKVITEGLKTVYDEQDSQITYCFGQEMTEAEDVSLEEYMNKIESVTREDVINVAKSININTIYFLKN